MTTYQPTLNLGQSLPNTYKADFDEYYWDALREACRISNGTMKQKHFNNLVLFIMFYKAGFLDNA